MHNLWPGTFRCQTIQVLYLNGPEMWKIKVLLRWIWTTALLGYWASGNNSSQLRLYKRFDTLLCIKELIRTVTQWGSVLNWTVHVLYVMKKGQFHIQTATVQTIQFHVVSWGQCFFNSAEVWVGARCSCAQYSGEPVIPANCALNLHLIVHCKQAPVKSLHHNKDTMPH